MMFPKASGLSLIPTTSIVTSGTSPPTETVSEQTPPTQPSDCCVVSCVEQLPPGAENFGDTLHVAQLESATAVSLEPVSRRSVNAWPPMRDGREVGVERAAGERDRDQGPAVAAARRAAMARSRVVTRRAGDERRDRAERNRGDLHGAFEPTALGQCARSGRRERPARLPTIRSPRVATLRKVERVRSRLKSDARQLPRAATRRPGHLLVSVCDEPVRGVPEIALGGRQRRIDDEELGIGDLLVRRWRPRREHRDGDPVTSSELAFYRATRAAMTTLCERERWSPSPKRA